MRPRVLAAAMDLYCAFKEEDYCLKGMHFSIGRSTKTSKQCMPCFSIIKSEFTEHEVKSKFAKTINNRCACLQLLRVKKKIKIE